MAWPYSSDGDNKVDQAIRKVAKARQEEAKSSTVLERLREKRKAEEEERKRKEQQEAAAKAASKQVEEIKQPASKPVSPPTGPAVVEEPLLPRPQNETPTVERPTVTPASKPETPTVWNDSLGYQNVDMDPEPYRSSWDTWLGTAESTRDRTIRWLSSQNVPEPMQGMMDRLLPPVVSPPSDTLVHNTYDKNLGDGPGTPDRMLGRYLNPLNPTNIMLPGAYMVPGLAKGFKESASWQVAEDRRLARLEDVRQNRQTVAGLVDPAEMDGENRWSKLYNVFATATESGPGKALGVAGANLLFAMDLGLESSAKYALGEMTRGQWQELVASGEIPEVLDTTYESRVGLVEPVINNISALWRTVQPQIVKENAPEILQIPEEERIKNGWELVPVEAPLIGEVNVPVFVGKAHEMTEQARATRTFIEEMAARDPEMSARLSSALTNFVSDSSSVHNTVEQIYTHDINIRQMEQEMAQAMIDGDAVAAQTLQYHITQEKNKSDLDIIDANANVWSELTFGLLADPTIVASKLFAIAGLTPELRAVSKALKEVQPEYIDNVLANFDEVAAQAGKIMDGLQENKFYTMTEEGLQETEKRGRFDPTILFRRTPEAQALTSTFDLHSSITNLTMHLDDPSDIRKVLQLLIDDPTELSKGVRSIVSGGAEKTKAERWYPGNWAFTNKSFTDNYPILKAARESIISMPEWQKATPDKTKLFAELDGVLFQTARRVYGDVEMPTVPVGTKSYERVGNKFIFKDPDGNVLGETKEFAVKEANNVEKTIDDIKNLAGQEQWGAGQFLVDMSAVSRSWLSNQYLNLRPGSWVRNALGFTANLAGDDTYSFKSINGMIEDISRIAGDMSPDIRLGEAFGQGFEEAMTGSKGGWLTEGSKRQAFGWVGKWMDNISGLGPIGRGGGKTWTGTTEIPAGPGKSIKFGEASGYTTALYKSSMRTLRKAWKQVVGDRVITDAVERGVDRHAAEKLAEYMAANWDQGRKGIRDGAIEFLQENRIPVTVDPELYGETLTPVQNKNLQDFMGALVGNVTDEGEAMQAIDDYIFNLRIDAAKPITPFPKQPGASAFFDRDAVNDAFELTEDITEGFAQSGLRIPEQARLRMKQKVSDGAEQLNNVLGDLQKDLADVQADGALDFMVDVMTQWGDARISYLVRKDQILETAADQKSGQAWNKATADLGTLWDEYVQESTDIIGKARTDLLSPNGLPDSSRSIERLMETIVRFDAEQNARARAKGLELDNITKGQESFREAVDANRELMQYGMAQMLDAYRRYPSAEGFSILYDAMLRMDMNGVLLGRHLANFGEMAGAGRLPYAVLYRNRNDAYNTFFDKMFEYFIGSGASILENGIAAKATSNPVDKMAAIPDALRAYWKHIDDTKPGFSPMRLVADSYEPTRDDFLEAAKRLKLPTGVGQKGQQNDWRYVLAWADQRIEGFNRNGRMGLANLTDDEKRLIFREMASEINLGQVDFFGIGPNEKLADVIREQNKAMKTLGGHQAMDVADVWASTDQQYARLRNELATIWKGDAGSPITAHDAVMLKDILDETMPYYDNVVGAAMSVGQRMGQFAMLNFADRRNIDTLASVIFPFHYFWSRSPRNWARRMATRPSVANWWYEAEKAIALENKQSGTQDTRWEDSMPNPMLMVNPDAPARVGNIIKYAMPNYGANPFVNPSEANNKYEATAKSIIQYGPGIAPQADILMSALFDAVSPLEDGTKRMDDYNFGDYLPWMRVGYYGLSAARGEFNPRASRLLGDEWDSYRIGREIASQVESPDPETQALAMLSGQVIKNLNDGKDAWEGIPDGDRDWIEENLPKYISRANWDRFGTLLSSSITGVGAYHRRPNEMEMREGKKMYGQGGWTPETPGGSKAGMTGMLEEYPGMVVSWAMSSLIGGSDRDDPVESAKSTRAWAELDEASEALKKKQSEILAKNPTIGQKEMRELTKAENDRLSAAFDELPQIDEKNTRGMNPQEKAEHMFQKMYDTSKEVYPGPTYPEGEDVTSEQTSLYYEEKAVAEEQRLQYMASRLEQLVSREEYFTNNLPPQDQAWWHEMKAMLQGRDVEQWIEMYKGRYQSDEYYEWKAGWDLYWSAVNFRTDEKDRRFEKTAPARFTPEERSLYDRYLEMPTSTPEEYEERLEFARDNSVIGHQRTMHLNPDEYEEGVRMWGEDWYDIQANIPSKWSMFGTDDTTAEQDQLYWTARDTYKVENPQAYAIRLWYMGRPKPDEMKDAIKEAVGEARGGGYGYLPNDWGKDYVTALEIFGEDVFQSQVNEAAASLRGTDAYFDWENKNWEDKKKNLAYNVWLYEMVNDPKSVADMTGVITKDWATQERDAVIEAMEESSMDQTVVIPGPQGSAPSYWRGAGTTPAMFAQEFGASVGAVPAEVFDPNKPFFAVNSVQPDPKEYMAPGILDQEVPGMGGLTNKQALGNTQKISQAAKSELPGLGTALALLDENFGDLVSADANTPEPKTMEELLKESDKYKELVGRKQKWAQWEADTYARQQFAVNTFGADPVKWNAYFDLAKGSDARKMMRDADPALDASLTFAYNPDKWQAAMDAGFTAEDAITWARRPDYVEGENERRTQFFNNNPRAFLFNSWINGRPGPKDSDEPTYERNWGADYGKAQEEFGSNIWQLVSQYRTLPKGTGARTQFREMNPNYNDWEEWWYAKFPDSGRSSIYSSSGRYYGTSGGYRRSYSGGGGGGSGSWSDNHDVKFPDGKIFVSPYRGMGNQQTPRFRSGLSQSADNWRRYMGGQGSRLMKWNTKLGG